MHIPLLPGGEMRVQVAKRALSTMLKKTFMITMR